MLWLLLSNSPDTVEGLRMLLQLLILVKELLICNYKSHVKNALIKNRGALPLARWRKGTPYWVYWTVWIRWPGISEPWEYKALGDTA